MEYFIVLLNTDWPFTVTFAEKPSNYPGADTGGGRGKFAPPNRFREGRSPPEFGIFCSYFHNSFSIACLIVKETLVQNRKNICLNKL